MKTILFDIDGTIADIKHRRVFLELEKPDWESFNSKMGEDVLNRPVAELYKALWDTGKYQLILITGRIEESRKLTEQWLFWNEIPFGRIEMRQDKDYRADYIVKEEILKNLQSEGLDIP
jgi:uncharacterized HAD superfamily protein